MSRLRNGIARWNVWLVGILLASVWLFTLVHLTGRSTHELEIDPSRMNADGGQAYVARLEPPAFPFVTYGDGHAAPRSTAQLFENGRSLGPAHTPHQTIRENGKGAFSHWGDGLWFSSSDGTDPRTNGYRYVVIAKRQLQPELVLAVVILTGLAVLLTRGFAPVARSIHALIFVVYGGLCAIGAAGCLLGVLLLAVSLLGVYAGDQLPAARLFKLLPDAHKVLHVVPIACLIMAVLGATVSWLATLHPLNRTAIRRREIVALRHAKAYGLVVVLAILLSMLSSGGWSGHIGPGEYHGYSLAGLVPYSDAGAYYRSSFDMGFGGEWNWVSSSRPLASAFRDLITYVGRYSYPTSLVVQAILLAIACYAAALSVAYWLGIWSALAFFAFALVMIRPFLPTAGSEPLSLIWAFLSIACLAHACRTRAVHWAVLALGFLSMAQFTRMGAVLVLGALSLWVLARPRYSAAHIAQRIALVVLAIGVPAALGSLLKSAYAFQSNFQYLGGVNFGGWNLGAVLCALGEQAGWSECQSLATQQMQTRGGSGPGSNVYSHVWQLIAANPQMILRPLVDNISTFFTILPQAIVFGYTERESSVIRVPMIFSVFALPGLLFYFVKRAASSEWLLWPLFWLTLVASSAAVFFIDGWRTLYATHPLMAAFLAIAFTTPSSLRPAYAPMNSGKTLALVGLPAILLVVAPWVVHWELGSRDLRQQTASAAMSGGRMITGFLVLPDGQVADRTIASLSYADFQAVLKFAKLDDRWRNSRSMFPAPPFAVVWSPRVTKVQSVEVFIAPVHVLQDRTVARWHFEVTPELNNDPILLVVRSAKPIEH